MLEIAGGLRSLRLLGGWGSGVVCMLGYHSHSLTVAEMEYKDGKIFYMHFFPFYTGTFLSLGVVLRVL